MVFSDSFGIILLVQSSIYYIRNTLSHCIFLSAPYARLSLGHFLMSAVKSWWWSWWCPSRSFLYDRFFNNNTSLWWYWAIQCWELALNCLDFSQGWHNSSFIIRSYLLFCHFLRWKCFWSSIKMWVMGSCQCWGIRFPYRTVWLGIIFLPFQDLLCTAWKQITIVLLIWADLKEGLS